jgi:hypothetical protein
MLLRLSEKKVSMRMIKTTTISILAVGLLAGSAVGVAAQDDAAVAEVTSFTGERTTQQDQVVEGTSSASGGLDEVTGSVYVGSLVASDPRLTGTYTSTDNYIVDTTEMLDDFSNFNVVSASTWELTNDGGSWIVEVTSFGNIEADVNAGWLEFTGQGGYEGLSAYAVADWRDSPQFVGTVFPRPMLEIPEPYAAE